METGATKYGTMGGTLLVVIIQINPEELIKTMVLAGVGALVSYMVTLGLKWVIRRMREGKRP